MEDGSKHKKAKKQKRCVIKRELMLENYKDSLLNYEIILKSQQRFKSDDHRVYIMMLRDYKNMIKLQHIHTEQMSLKCVKMK